MVTNNIGTNVSTRYWPLQNNGDSFRLLRVLPSLCHGSPLRCELFKSSISREQDQYIAGSYVWGPPEPKRSIFLDGGPFQVRDNLYRFLKAFRSRGRPQVIWLDAICINQDDIQERSHQVQQMKRIYSGAKCVYSWLGYDEPLPHTGIFDRQYIIDLYYRCMRDERQHARQRDQLEYISKAEYWSRMWIVQEVILAKEVQLLVGRNRLPFTELAKIIKDVASVDGWTAITQSKGRIFALFISQSTKGSLESLFGIFGMLPRSIPLDGVFALLGLLKGTEGDLRLISIVDYSLTVWQLLQQILAQDILQSPPFKFAEQYNRYVIKGQRDDYMGGHVGLELMESPPRQLSGTDASRYARTGRSTPDMAIAIRMPQAIRYLDLTEAATIEVATYTSQWRTISGQCGVSVGLSGCYDLPTKPVSFCTDALVETCDSRCATTCATHAVVGFSWAFSHELEQPRGPKPTALIDVPLLTSSASGDVAQLIHNIQQRSAEMVEAIRSKVRMTANGKFSDHRNRTRYKLETDVETMVTFSTFIRDLETHDGWQELLELALDLTRKSGTEEDATRSE